VGLLVEGVMLMLLMDSPLMYVITRNFIQLVGITGCTKNKQQSYFILTGQSDYWTRVYFSIKQGILRLPLSHNVHGEADEAC